MYASEVIDRPFLDKWGVEDEKLLLFLLIQYDNQDRA